MGTECTNRIDSSLYNELLITLWTETPNTLYQLVDLDLITVNVRGLKISFAEEYNVMHEINKKKVMRTECTMRIIGPLTTDISGELNSTLETDPITTIHPNPHHREFMGMGIEGLSLAVGGGGNRY